MLFYKRNDGVFTAPTAGVYVFFVNVQSYNSLSVYVDIVVNGARKVRTMASNHYDGVDSTETSQSVGQTLFGSRLL